MGNKQQVATLRTWLGPLPPPETLEAFKHISPNAVDLILKMAEDESKHRQEMERLDHEFIYSKTSRDLDKGYSSVFIGQIIAAVIISLVIIGSVVCAFLGATEIGCTLAGVGIANIAAVFIGHEYKKHK